ncbi:MAG: flagellar biosynthetic protein FliO [Firmicutes bacterium]|nr:flagellar biosynthetic protein FliO [Bacillota bacterium]
MQQVANYHFMGWSTSTAVDLGQFANFIIVFIVVCILAYFTARLLGGVKYGRLGKRNIEIIETIGVGQAAFVHLVRLGNECVLIGVTKGQITFLTKVADGTIDLSLYQKNANPPIGFETLLNKFKKENISTSFNFKQKAERELNELYELDKNNKTDKEEQ